jgi:two-component system OmpR family response regulator
MLTARDGIEDRVTLLNGGADDYLTKPFAIEELTARIRALIRRASSHPEPIVTIGELRIDLARRRVYRNAEEVELTGREYGILELLVRHRGAVVARANLHEHLYDDENELMSNAIDVHIAALRRKLGPTVIQTRRGLGYLIDA